MNLSSDDALTLDEIREMPEDLVEANADYLRSLK
jgi:hypothetical protein